MLHREQPGANVGLAVNYVVFEPARDNVLDRSLAASYDALFNRAALSYLQGEPLPLPFALMAAGVPECVGKIDFVGLNVYNRLHVRAPLGEKFGPGGLYVPRNVPQGDHGVAAPYGEAYPKVVSAAVAVYAALGCPMYVMENGVPDRADRIRPWLLVNSLRELRRMWQQGYDVRGYFHWSLVDNFEWSEGWHLRFGLYELDAATQQRTPAPAPNSTARSSPTRESAAKPWSAGKKRRRKGHCSWRKFYLYAHLRRCWIRRCHRFAK